MIDTFSATSPLILVGCGKMGGAMLTGWLDRGLSPGGVIVVEKMPSDALVALAAERGFALRPTPPEGVVARVLLVAVKVYLSRFALGSPPTFASNIAAAPLKVLTDWIRSPPGEPHALL